MNTPIRLNVFRSRAELAPFAELEDFFRSFGFRPIWRETDVISDIHFAAGEDGANYRIQAEIPGVEENDIELPVDGDQASIRVEQSGGRVHRVFTLPVDIDAGKTEANYGRGVPPSRFGKAPTENSGASQIPEMVAIAARSCSYATKG